MKIVKIAKIIFFLCVFTIVAQANNSENVSRASFCLEIDKREPLYPIESASQKDINRIQFFSEIMNKKGEAIYHIWKNAGKVIYRHRFDIGGNRWRVWTNVSIFHFQPGDTAIVSIEDATGQILLSKELPITY